MNRSQIACLSVIVLAIPLFVAAQTVLTNVTIVGALQQGTSIVSNGVVGVALGEGSVASGQASVAFGQGAQAVGQSSHAEGYETVAEGDAAHSQGYGTEALAPNSHASGSFSAVLPEHTNAFIHAVGTAAQFKETLVQDAAHFDQILLLDPALDMDQSVLSRAEADARYDVRYATSAQGAMAATAVQPDSTTTLASVSIDTLTLGGGTRTNWLDAFDKPESDARYVQVTGDAMSGTLDMQSNSVLDIARVAVNTDAPQGRLHVYAPPGSPTSFNREPFLLVGPGKFKANTMNYFYDNLYGGGLAYWYTPYAMIRQDSASTNLAETKAGMVLYNDDIAPGNWVKLAMAGRETQTGNATALAGIAARKVGSAHSGWSVGDLALWTKLGNAIRHNIYMKGGNGFVGIGTSAPESLLHVAGTLRADGNASMNGALNVAGDAAIAGDITVSGWLAGFVAPAGGLSMGTYTNGPHPPLP